jgi:hypothetical protein
MVRALGVGLALAAACSHTVNITVGPEVLEPAVGRLRTRPVQVVTSDGPVTIRPDQRVEIVTFDGTRFPIAVTDLARDCPPHEAELNRLCELHNVRQVVVGSRQERTGSVPVAAVLATAVLGGTIACGALCPKPYNYISWGTLGTLVVGSFLLYAYGVGRSGP